MKKKLLLALALLGWTHFGAYAQPSTSCNATLSKTGTGMTRTYTVNSGPANATYDFRILYENAYYMVGSTGSGPASAFTQLYTQPGYYYALVYISSASCTDTLYIADTVAGTVNCTTPYFFYTYQHGTGPTILLEPSWNPAQNFPTYTSTVSYSYGDGTSGTSNVHTYPAAGTYQLVATNVFTSPQYGSCTTTNSHPIYVNAGNPSAFDCYNVRANFTVHNVGSTYTFTDSSINLNPSTLATTSTYSWKIRDAFSQNNINGATSSTSSFTYNFTQNGVYRVNLIHSWKDSITNTILCADTTERVINVVMPAPNAINATAHWDSTMNAAGALVKFWLINYDSSTQMLTAVDSALVPATSSSFATAIWTGKPAGAYRVKAHMINQPSAWTTALLPTYGFSAAYWQSASITNHTGATSTANIYLQQGIPMNGSGFIGGLVTQGANKGTAVGDPIPNLTIFLRDAANTPVASTVTDANGTYSFNNVPLGWSYTVYPEELNFATTSSALLLPTTTAHNLTGIDFKYEPGMMQINPVSLDIPLCTTGEISIFPNPTKDVVNIQFPQTPEKGAVIRLLNLNGQVIRSQEVNASSSQQMNVSGLAAGTYLLQVPGANTTYRIAIQK